MRAETSRDAGNVMRFCHWRQIERVIATLSSDDIRGTIPLGHSRYWRGSGGLARLAHVFQAVGEGRRGGDGRGRSGAGPGPAGVRPAADCRRRPTSTRRRRSIRCPTWGSNGPTWRPPTHAASPEAAGEIAPRPPPSDQIDDSAAARRYAVVLAGLDQVADADLLKAFREQSALEDGVKKPANAAQIDRRARADAELLTELLQPRAIMTRGSSRGSRSRRGGARVRRDGVPRCGAGRAIPLRIGRAARARSGRRGCGQAARGVRGQGRATRSSPTDVIAAGIALKVALGQQGFAHGQDRRAGHRHRPRDADRAAGAAGRPRAGRAVRRDPRDRPAAVRRRAMSGRSPASRPATASSSRMSTICAAPWSRPGLVSSVEVTVTPVGAGRDGRPRRAARAGADADDRRRAWLWHRRGRSRRGELAAPQFLQSRRRADRARGGRHAGATRRGVVPAQQFPPARPGAQRAGIGEQRRSRRLCGEDPAAVGRDRAAEQFHLAQEMDLEPRRRDLLASDERDTIESTGEERRRTFFIAALPASLGYDGSDDLLDPTRGFRLLGRISPEVSLQSGTFGLWPGPVRRQRLSPGVRQGGRRRPRAARHDRRRRAAT